MERFIQCMCDKSQFSQDLLRRTSVCHNSQAVTYVKLTHPELALFSLLKLACFVKIKMATKTKSMAKITIKCTACRFSECIDALRLTGRTTAFHAQTETALHFLTLGPATDYQSVCYPASLACLTGQSKQIQGHVYRQDVS